jgi:hypothetical protein
MKHKYMLKLYGKHFLLFICAIAFIYASFSAYDGVNKRLKLAQEKDTPPIWMKTLSAQQAKTLAYQAAQNKQKIGPLYFGRYLHKSTLMYSDVILDALKRSGLEITEDLIAPDTPEQTGVMVACDNPEEPSDSARAIIDVFKSADIDITITNMLSQARNNGARGCILFIGPDPL